MLFKKTAVIGQPINHSLSPKLHNYWIGKTNIGVPEYGKIEISPENFEMEMDRLIAEGYYGLNVTVPLKELAYKKASKLSDVSITTSAVNTLIFKNGTLFGTNTDPVGFESSLQKDVIQKNISNKNCLVLGAGGSAKAIIYALNKLSAKISVCNRTHEKLKELKKVLNISFESIKQEDLVDQLKKFDCIINTTSLGLIPDQKNNFIDFNKTKISCYVYDLIYNPIKTDFLREAHEHGLKTQNGLKMLIGQAAASFYIWHGVNPPINDEIETVLEIA